MDRAYGPLPHWWPAESAYEVMVGALLVQQTRWQQVEQSLLRLRSETALDPSVIANVSEPQLAEWIRPSGFHRQKASRLLALNHWWTLSGGETELSRWDTPTLRHALLAQAGVGPETADAILLYGFRRPVFVVDAYLRRIIDRVGVQSEAASAALAASCLQACGYSEAHCRRAHAQVVMHAQLHCRKTPICNVCPLSDGCAYAGSSMSANR